MSFAVGVLLAVLVSFGLRFLVDFTAFWLLDSRGVLTIYAVVTPLLAGLIIPCRTSLTGRLVLARAVHRLVVQGG